MTDFANGYDHKMLGSTGTCYIRDAVRSERLVPSLVTRRDIFVFDDNDSLVDSLTQGTSAKDRYEKRATPPDPQAHYPSGLGYRSALLQEMIQADRDGDEGLALRRLAELEAYYHAEKYESPWWKFLYLISFP